MIDKDEIQINGSDDNLVSMDKFLVKSSSKSQSNTDNK